MKEDTINIAINALCKEKEMITEAIHNDDYPEDEREAHKERISDIDAEIIKLINLA